MSRLGLDELAELYPGSRHQRRDKPEPRPDPEIPIWDDRPYRKVISGVEREFFTLGALGKALGRPLVTLRLWIRQGHLPAATYRLPTTELPIFDGSGNQVGSREQKGRRLYTREQIEVVIRIADRHGLLGSARVEWSEHPTFGGEIADEWRSLKKQSTNN